LRTAELGLRGLVVVTLVQTPRLNGDAPKEGLFLRVLNVRKRAGVLDFLRLPFRPLETN
jgi:hypothetical protein